MTQHTILHKIVEKSGGIRITKTVFGFTVQFNLTVADDEIEPKKIGDGTTMDVDLR